MTLEDNSKPYPCNGPIREKPKSNFNPYLDVHLRDFILCWPTCNNHLPMKMEQLLRCIDMSLEDDYDRFSCQMVNSYENKEGVKKNSC